MQSTSKPLLDDAQTRLVLALVQLSPKNGGKPVDKPGKIPLSH